MIITRKWLEDKGACSEGKEWFLRENILELSDGVKNLFAKDHFSWAYWLLTKSFTRIQNVQFAVYTAKQVLSIFEKQYPKDKRPRNAIRAAEKYLKNPNAANASYAAYAASDATYAASAAYAASYAAYAASDAAYAASYAAYAASDAAYAASDPTYAANAANAAYAASGAAYAASYAAYAANAASDATYAANAAYARIALQKKIIAYGLKLIK
jgi:hypothetical protein